MSSVVLYTKATFEMKCPDYRGVLIQRVLMRERERDRGKERERGGIERERKRREREINNL